MVGQSTKFKFDCCVTFNRHAKSFKDIRSWKAIKRLAVSSVVTLGDICFLLVAKTLDLERFRFVLLQSPANSFSALLRCEVSITQPLEREVRIR